MEKFSRHTGVAIAMLRNNIDTDAIIPSREMQGVSKQGLGDGLFAGWRYQLPGGRIPNPEFALNKARYSGASVLLSGNNFGCGSSREHAVWALKEFGFRVIIAASFGTIFHDNCVRNGVLPIALPFTEVEVLCKLLENLERPELSVDLHEQSILINGGITTRFEIEPADKYTLVSGLDPIAATQLHADAIEAFAHEQRQQRPWIAINSAGQTTR